MLQGMIETTRLILRPFESADAEAAFGWFGDPLVMRFTATGPDKSIEQTQARLARYQEHQTAHGFSKWIILDRGSRCAIGDSGLMDLKECGWIDLGYRFARPYWGKGLATEAASAWVRAGFDELHFDQINAFVHPENVASIRVLEKLNFRTLRRDTIMGMDAILFSLRAEDARRVSRKGPDNPAGETMNISNCQNTKQGQFPSGPRCGHRKFRLSTWPSLQVGEELVHFSLLVEGRELLADGIARQLHHRVADSLSVN